MDQQKINQFKHRMNTLAYGEAMLAAARDYGEELLEKERKENEARKYAQMDLDDLMDDPELEALHEQRINELKAEREKRAQMSHKGHGELTDISEGEFLEIVTKTKQVACHFYHKDFERCKIMDKHLRILAPQYFETRFCRVSAPDTPFFVAKLQVQMLPCVIFFVDGVAVDRVVGFEELGAKDDFDTAMLERRMLSCRVLKVPVKQEDDEELEQKRTSVRKAIAQRAVRDPEDEDSDFD